MTTPQLTPLLMPLLMAALIVGGVAVLYRSWISKSRHHLYLLGWALISAGLWVATVFTGSDRGVALGLITVCIVGLLFVAIAALAQRRRTVHGSIARERKRKIATGPGGVKRRDGQASVPTVPGATLGRRFGLFLMAGPVALLLAFSLALLVHQSLLFQGVEPANALVLELFAFPVLWAAIAVWCLMAPDLPRRAWVVGAIQLVCIACLFGFTRLSLTVPGV